MGLGLPLENEQLSQAPHLICEIAGRENFGDAWRILQILFEGNSKGCVSVDAPRFTDGWSPLCVACARSCVPLVAKLLELDADPNVITRDKQTPMSLARKKL